MKNHQVIIIGGGPAGATTALYLLQLGIKPVLLEKEAFSRYHIGESLTGEAGNALRSLGLEKAMDGHGFPVKHGVVVYGTTALAEYESLSERGQDIIQDLVDVFWDYPLRFVVLTHHARHRDEIIDMFAGRIFTEAVFKSAALLAIRQCLPQRSPAGS